MSSDTFRWSPGCKCCDCYEFVDLFERADSTNIGSDWQECTGDWSISGGRLTVDAAGEAALLHMDVPESEEEVGIFTAECEVHDGGSPTPTVHTGAKYQIVIFTGTVATPCSGGVGAGGQYIVELTVVSDVLGEIRLFGPSGLIGSAQEVVFSNQTFFLQACVSHHQIVCGELGALDMWTCPEGDIEGHYFAVGDGGGAARVFFESITYTDHFDHDPSCPACIPLCCCTCIEDTADRGLRILTATISADTATGEDCASLDGLTLDLSCDGIDFECCTWQNTTDAFEFTCNADGFNYGLKFWMHCTDPNDACEGYTGYLDWAPGYDNASCCIAPSALPDDEQQSGPPASTSCECTVGDDPNTISLTFGPFELWRNPSNLDPDCCKCCQVFYVVVTS